MELVFETVPGIVGAEPVGRPALNDEVRHDTMEKETVKKGTVGDLVQRVVDESFCALSQADEVGYGPRHEGMFQATKEDSFARVESRIDSIRRW